MLQPLWWFTGFGSCAPDHAEGQEGGDEGRGHAKQREQHRDRGHVALLGRQATAGCQGVILLYCQPSRHPLNGKSAPGGCA